MKRIPAAPTRHTEWWEQRCDAEESLRFAEDLGDREQLAELAGDPGVAIILQERAVLAELARRRELTE